MKLLDLFCGVGGAAMGYHRAGFQIVGVDFQEQPNFPFEFRLGDVFELDPAEIAGEFDAVHASPPCLAYSKATAWRSRREDHRRLIGPTRELLIETGLPYVIENVQTAKDELRSPVKLCGSMYGLPFRRHRYFELSFTAFWLQHPCRHRRTDFSHDHGLKQSEAEYRDAMGLDWANVHEARLAIPPAFTEDIGRELAGAVSLARIAA